MPAFSGSQQNAIESLARDLEEVFGARLHALVAYPGSHADGSTHSCAIVDALSFNDLARCLPFTDRWHQRRVAVPLMLSAAELERTVDIFPLEYAAIIADHAVVRGADPFAGMTIDAGDVRRAIEAQAKSHLIHLREAYLETRGETTRIAQILAASAPSFRALLTNIARLTGAPDGTPPDEALAAMAHRQIGLDAALLREILASSAAGPSSVTDPSHLLSRYVEATEKIWTFVDAWAAR